jgi:hypothetical protein
MTFDTTGMGLGNIAGKELKAGRVRFRDAQAEQEYNELIREMETHQEDEEPTATGESGL